MIYLCSISTKASTASKQQQGKTKKWLEIHPNKKREKKNIITLQTVKWVLNFFLLSIFPKTELQRTDQIWVSELRNAPLLWVAFSKCHWGGWDEINTAMQRTSKEQKSAKMVKEFYCYCLSYNTDCHNGFSWVNWTTSMKRKACERYAGISLPQSTRLSSHSKK